MQRGGGRGGGSRHRSNYSGSRSRSRRRSSFHHFIARLGFTRRLWYLFLGFAFFLTIGLCYCFCTGCKECRDC